MKAGFCTECEANVYLDDQGNCVKGHPAASVRDVYDVEAPGSSVADSPSSTSDLPLHKRKWFLPATMFIVGLLVGSAAASPAAERGSGDVDLKAEVEALQSQVDELTVERDELESERDELAEELDPIKRAEEEAAAAAKAQADEEAKAKAEAEAAAKAAADAAAAEVAANTFTDGVYLVGVDMKPGRYKGEVTSDMGYWAVLADPNGSDIIENNIVKGQFYVQVKEGQYIELTNVRITWVQ